MARSTRSVPRNTGGRSSAAPARAARRGSTAGPKPGRAPRSEGRRQPGTRSQPAPRARPGVATASSQRTRAGVATTPRAQSSTRAGPRQRPRGRGRNPNRWRFYVLLALLALIAAVVLWFTVGRDAVAAYRQADAGADPGQSPSAPAEDERDDAPPPASPAGPERGSGSERDAGGAAPREDAEPDAHALANPVQCRADALDIAVDTEGRTHDAGDPVAIRIAVTNTGAVPCLVDVGHEEMAVIITSGSDQVWHNQDCPRGEGERRLLLDIGADVAHTLTWPGDRCGGGPAGEGTYRIATELNAEAGSARAQTVVELR